MPGRWPSRLCASHDAGSEWTSNRTVRGSSRRVWSGCPRRWTLGDRVTVRFPWGSLLRGALGLDAAVTDSIARLVAPGGRLELTLSVVGRDAPMKTGLAAGLGEAARTSMVTAFADHGLELDEIRELTADDLATLHSAWARRLRAGGDRPAWRVAFTRPLRAVG